jgi:Fic family protein
MEDLFVFIKETRDISWLIKGCFFHYELEFIHPFSDDNGRIGRLWQQIILMKENPAFEYISVESMIRNDQNNYYEVLSECDKKGDSTTLIEYSLKQISTALNIYLKSIEVRKKMTSDERLQYAQEKFKRKRFQRKEYIQAIQDISTATASRDLEYGVINGILLKFGDKKLSEYEFKAQKNHNTNKITLSFL